MTIREALALHHAGRLSEAEALYRQIIAAQPKNFHALHFLGVLRAQTGDMSGSVDLVRRALVIQPNDPLAQFHLAEALRALNRHGEAAAAYGKAAALKPDFAEAFSGKAAMLVELKKWNDALEAATRALSLKRDLYEAEISRGLALHGLDRSVEALKAFERAIALQPRIRKPL